jgi:hypothetical protein
VNFDKLPWEGKRSLLAGWSLAAVALIGDLAALGLAAFAALSDVTAGRGVDFAEAAVYSAAAAFGLGKLAEAVKSRAGGNGGTPPAPLP